MADSLPSMSRNTNGLPSMMRPQPQSRKHPIIPSRQPAIDLESTDGSGRGSPIPSASRASPQVPLPRDALTRAAIEAHLQAFNHNSITPSPSPMVEIACPSRPKPQRFLTSDAPAPPSDVLLIDDFPQPSITKETDVTILVDCSALIKPSSCKETSLGSSIGFQVPQPVLGSPANPAPFVILNVRPSDTIPVIHANIRNEVLNQPFLANERELAVQRADEVQLCVVWIQGDRFGQTILSDEDALRKSLALMEKRGWIDYFNLRMNDPYEKLKDLNVQNDLKEEEVPHGNGKGKEKELSRQRRKSSASSVERNTLADGGVPL